MLAARELNVEKLPESSRNWINEKLVYTHGYGVTMNPVNGFTSEGLPTLLLSNMPVQSTVKGLNVTRPEIYFGELTDTDVYVKTRQQEFDFPQGQTNSVTSYQGTGGIVLGGFLRRILLAFERDDLGKLPFSDNVNTAEPPADAAQHPRARRHPGALPYLRPGPLHRGRRRRPALLDDGRLHHLRQLSLLHPLDLDDNLHQLHAQQRQSGDRRLQRRHHLLRLRQRRPGARCLPQHLPQPLQGRRADARRPAQACALSGKIVQAAGGGLWPLPHDGPGGLLQPRRPVDGGHRVHRPEQRWAADHACQCSPTSS